MIMPAATMNQGGVQFILRQQPAQPQVLTIQSPVTTATIGAQNNAGGNGKPIVRFMSQISQVPQATQVSISISNQ